MTKIRETAVKRKNTAVHRQEFYSMVQEDGQSTQQFLAKLRSKADQCTFQLACSSSLCNHTINSYSSVMVGDILTVGCYDKDIQGELLARSNTVKSLEKLELMQAMGSGKHARDELMQESRVTAQRSTHRRAKQQSSPHHNKP